MNVGWYPDPDDENARRYWDGKAWSAPLAHSPTADDVEADPRAAVRAQFAKAARDLGLSESVVGSGDAAIVCPHCQTRGRVHTARVKQKKGISGGKATGAILTGGLSMLGTGLSRKETVTEFRCDQCSTTWQG